jgi:hypothetical protein
MYPVYANYQSAQDNRHKHFAITGQHGVLRGWPDGSVHYSTREPTFSVDVVYIDRFSGKQERQRQRGLRASTVANICACVCLGEEHLSTKVVDKINEKFGIKPDC